MHGSIEIIDNMDDEFLEDFSENIHAALCDFEQHMMGLHLADNVEEHFVHVIHSIQAVKTCCRATFIEPLEAYVQICEDLATALNSKLFPLSEFSTEFVLLAFDEIRAASEDLAIRKCLDSKLLDEFREEIKSFLVPPIDQTDKKIRSLILKFSPRVHPNLVFTAFEYHHQEEGKIATIHPSQEKELSIFEDFSRSLDSRSKYWSNRTKLIHAICAKLNGYLSDVVTPKQLSAAVYMHDVCMCFLPDKILFKHSKYNSMEEMLLQQHPIQASQLIRLTPNWEEAAQIVYQHHEHFDGTGYPNAVGGSEICQGAKILAIADAYYALTNIRSDRNFKKSNLRALSEMNKYNGTQFDPKTLQAFNDMLSGTAH